MGNTTTYYPITRHRMQLGDVAIAFQSAGEGPPVVLVHGLSGSSRCWQHNVQALAQHFHVYVIDLAGFGESRGQRFVLEVAARYLIEWMDRLEIGCASFIGHSMGGYITAAVAADYSTRVQRLVLVDAAVLPFNWMYLQFAQGLIRELLHLPWGFLPTLVLDALRAGPNTLWSALNEIMKIDLRQRLMQITVPTLLVWGERDELVPLSFGRQLASELPQSTLVTIAGAGHNAMWDCPMAFNSVTTHFLRGGSLALGEQRVECRATLR